MATMMGHALIVCFGFHRATMRKQPWNLAHGLAIGMNAHGTPSTIITDIEGSVATDHYATHTIPLLFDRGRCSPELERVVRESGATRVFLVTGAWALCRLETLPGPAPWTLVLTSPRLYPHEWARLGLNGLIKEWHLLKLPLVHSLLPGFLLRRGLAQSGASHIIYASRAAQDRYHKAGLPLGQVLRPQIPNFKANQQSQYETPIIVYFGPPLRLRGADLAITTFEKAVRQGLNAHFLVLLRPDVDKHHLLNCQLRAAQSPYAARITVETRMLDPQSIQKVLADASAFLLPFNVTVSDTPLVVIEAGLTGKPVIVLDTPGVSEVAAAFRGYIAGHKDDLPNLLVEALAEPKGRRLERLGISAVWTHWPREVSKFLNNAANDHDVTDLPHMLCLSGVDGCGKTHLLRHIRDEFFLNGIDHRHVWSRFRNYLSKPLLFIARITGHNRKEQIGGVHYGVHDFRDVTWLVRPFLILQFIDNVIDILFRYHLSRRRILGDRCVLDTLVDLAADTGRDDIVFGIYGRILLALLPQPVRLIIINRPIENIIRDRPDALVDPLFFERRRLFQVAAERFSIPVIHNQEAADVVARRILGTKRRTEGNTREARTA